MHLMNNQMMLQRPISHLIAPWLNYLAVWATAQSQIEASLRAAVAPNVLTRNKIFAIHKTCHQQ